MLDRPQAQVVILVIPQTVSFIEPANLIQNTALDQQTEADQAADLLYLPTLCFTVLCRECLHILKFTVSHRNTLMSADIIRNRS